MAHQGRGDYDRAIADYDKAIALDPDLADARYNRGVARRESGR
jgi:tetratricopeptide (TPR) repeat protein